MISVSILMPAYNHERFIVDALDSIYIDNNNQLELIVIDDGSTDSTKLKIENWIADHPDININFISRPNRGVTATINELIRLASGEYIRLFASDDLNVAGSTFKLRDFLLKHKQSGIRAVLSDVEVIDSNSNIIFESGLIMNGAVLSEYVSNEGLKKQIISNWAAAGPCFLIEKSWFYEYGFYDEDLLIEDWFLFLQMVAHGALIYMPGKVAMYRIHDANACKTTDPKRRIKNLLSQEMAGSRCVELFSGKDTFLLKAEIYLIKTKINFLGRGYIQSVFYYLVSKFYKVRSFL